MLQSSYLCRAGIRRVVEDLEESILDVLQEDMPGAMIPVDGLRRAIEDCVARAIEDLDATIEDIAGKERSDGYDEGYDAREAEQEELDEAESEPVRCPACNGTLHEETGSLTCDRCRRVVSLSVQ